MKQKPQFLNILEMSDLKIVQNQTKFCKFLPDFRLIYLLGTNFEEKNRVSFHGNLTRKGIVERGHFVCFIFLHMDIVCVLLLHSTVCLYIFSLACVVPFSFAFNLFVENIAMQKLPEFDLIILLFFIVSFISGERKNGVEPLQYTSCS